VLINPILDPRLQPLSQQLTNQILLRVAREIGERIGMSFSQELSLCVEGFQELLEVEGERLSGGLEGRPRSGLPILATRCWAID
jgi:hypothetical protein